jgi:hypothetical protein
LKNERGQQVFHWLLRCTGYRCSKQYSASLLGHDFVLDELTDFVLCPSEWLCQNLCVVEKEYQITAFAIDHSDAQAAAHKELFRNLCVVEKECQITAFAIDHIDAQAAAPQERRPLVLRHLCVVKKEYQITAFAVDHSAAQAVAP